MVTVVGSYNVGLFLKGIRLPLAGETVLGHTYWEGGGGKGSNQAVAAARLGAPTRLIARIGADGYGRNCLAQCQRYGIGTDHIYIDDSIHSGVSVIFIDEDGRNQIMVVPGANAKLSSADLDAAADLFAQSRVTGFQLENSLEVVEYGIRQVHAMGVPTLLDPAPARALPDDLYPCLDYIKPNETEATTLTGIAVRDEESAIAAGEWLLNRGVGAAIITLGDKGSVLVTDKAREYFPAPEVSAVDSTGAGDVFSGALMARLDAGQSLPDAIRFATRAAALSVTRKGVIEAIPALDEVEAFAHSA